VLFAPSWFNLSSSGGRDVGSRRTSGVVQMSLHVMAEAMTIGLLSLCIDSDAALISPDGQPNPRAQVGWISAPHFYRQGRLIVLYVGCTGEIIETLNGLMGPAIARGPGCN